MAQPVFSDAWATAWKKQINASETYRVAAARWEGAIVLEMRADPDLGISEKIAIYSDLWHGVCREARIATSEDLEKAPYVISAFPKNWKRILDSDLDPILALMSGKLQLKKGSMVSLLPYVKAAKELVAAAARVDTKFPEEWNF